MQIVKWIIAVLLVLLPFGAGAQPNTDEYLQSRLSYLKQYPKDKQTLRELGFYYLNRHDYDQVIVYGNRLLKASISDGKSKHGVMYAYTCLGQAYTLKGDSSLAQSYLNSAREIGEECKNDSALCSIYNGLGIYSLYIQKDYYQATAYLFKGIEAAKRCQYKRLQCILLSNLSAAYYHQKDVTGLKYALECYELSHELKDPFFICFTSVIAAYFYYMQADYQSALRYLNEGEFLMQKNGFKEEANIYSLMGNVLRKLHRNDEALVCFEKVLAQKEQGEASTVASAYLGLAKLLVEQHEYERAIRLLKEGISSSYQRSSTIYRADLEKTLSDCYAQSGNLREALHWYKSFHEESDSLYNAEKERAVGEIRAKYDLERHENELKEQKLELLDKEHKMQLLFMGLCCLLLVASALYYLYYRKNKLYLTIVKQNQEAIRREQQLKEKIVLQDKTLADKTVAVSQPEKYASSSLTDEKKQDLFLRLESLLCDGKVYKDNLLTKEKVAEMLNTNRTYLSQIINEQTKLTFTQFVNSFRIQEAVRLLSDPQDETPLKAIAAELGFSSMTTFYTQFQHATGMTPAQYRNKVQELRNSK